MRVTKSIEHADIPTVDYVCIKCQTANPQGTRRCQKCNSRLYLKCRRCGHRNPRTLQACGSCGRRLHRTLWRRVSERLFSRHRKVRPMEILMLLIVLALIYWFIQHLGQGPLFPSHNDGPE